MQKNEKQNKDNTKQTSLRMPMEMYKKIEELSNTNERTVADQTRYMLKKYIELIEVK